MLKNLPHQYKCSKCGKISSTVGYFCPHCGGKKEKTKTYFTDYDFDLFPYPRVRTSSSSGRHASMYVKKVVIAFGLFALLGAGALASYTLYDFSMEPPQEEVILQLDEITFTTGFEEATFSARVDIERGALFETNAPDMIYDSFDLYVESMEPHKLNHVLETSISAIIQEDFRLGYGEVREQIDGTVSMAIRLAGTETQYVVIGKPKHREFGRAVVDIVNEREEFYAEMVEGYILVSANEEYLKSNIDSFEGINRKLSQSGYFVDTIRHLPQEGQAFIFIKNARGVEFYERTFDFLPPSPRLPLGLVIDGDTVYYVEFDF